MSEVRIRDLYTGQPDARDEVDFEGEESFLESYVMPPNFDLDGLLRGSKYFITGYKGTGKTALLLYMDHLFREQDEQTVTSYLFFKSDYDVAQRNIMTTQSENMMSTMEIRQKELLDVNDFSSIWRWHLFLKMVQDNESSGRKLFVQDEAFSRFETLVLGLLPGQSPKKGFLDQITFGGPILGGLMDPTVTITFNKRDGSKGEFRFSEVIALATTEFRKTKRTEVPYYIFIDELEAFYGDMAIFKRDLRLLRDLILETRELNRLIVTIRNKNHTSDRTKIICSVRTEILNTIGNHVEPKELNKVSTLSCQLTWHHRPGAAHEHPLIRVLLKRIEVAERRAGNPVLPEKELFRKWFPEKIQVGSRELDPVRYILNNSWSKPRDMVRFLDAAKNCLHNSETCFNSIVFDDSFQKYSEESLMELKEEMQALYTPSQIASIFSCLTGIRSMFTASSLQKRIEKYYPDSFLSHRLYDILRDLYRLGIIGNCNPEMKKYRWQYLGDNEPLFNHEGWLLMLHRGLYRALSTITPENPAANGHADPNAESANTPAPAPAKAEEAGPAEEFDPEEDFPDVSEIQPEEDDEEEAAAPVVIRAADPELKGMETLLTDITPDPNGIRGFFLYQEQKYQGFVPLRFLGDISPERFSGSTLRVILTDVNPGGGSYEFEPAEALVKPQPTYMMETVLHHIEAKPNGGIKGIFGEENWQGTVSRKRLQGLDPKSLVGGELRVRILEKNPLGDSYCAEILQ